MFAHVSPGTLVRLIVEEELWNDRIKFQYMLLASCVDLSRVHRSAGGMAVTIAWSKPQDHR